MASRNSSPRSRKSVSMSVMLGTLLVPLQRVCRLLSRRDQRCGRVGDCTGDVTGCGASRHREPVHGSGPGDSL